MEYKTKVLALTQERLKKLSELSELTWFFFKDPSATLELIELMLAETKLDKSRAITLLDAAIEAAEKSDFSIDALHSAFYTLAESQASKPGEFFTLLRIALVGGKTAPGLFETMNLLGHETTLRRLKAVRNS